MSTRPAIDARMEALAGLVDYAGLFPPAELDMTAAVAEYRRLANSPQAWFVNRFICPASRLAELAEASGGDRMPVSVVLDTPLADVEPSIDVVLVEARGVPPGSLPAPAVVEVAWDASMIERLAELSESGVFGAKLRCGGLRAELFPPPERLAAFMVACRRLGMPYKLTAGLHHAVRHDDPTTRFTHHGFLNVVAAEVLGRAHGLGEVEVARIIAERDAGAFRLEASELGWRHLSAGPGAVADGRRGLLAFGSCDAAEPLADLVALGVLPLEPAA